MPDDFLYGELNSWTKPALLNKIDANFSSFEKVSRSSTIAAKGSEAVTKKHRAIVLYAWYGETDGFWNLFADPPAKTVYVKARIIRTEDDDLQTPQIDQFSFSWKLPVGNNRNDEQADWEGINRHITYPAAATNVSNYGLPEPREEIYVSFESINPHEGPVYLGPVETHGRKHPPPVEVVSPAAGKT